MASPRGNLFVALGAAGSGYTLAGSVPSLADGFIARTTATITWWDTGATPNASVGMWLAPGETWRYSGPVAQVNYCAQGAGAVAFIFYIGAL